MTRFLTRALTVAALLLGTSALAQAAPFRLIITDLETGLVPNSVMDLAVQGGYFEREGVDVELVRVQQTPSAVAALQAGEGEMANIGTDALLQLIGRGSTDLRAVMSPNKSLPFLIAAKAEIATPADLVGKSFGVGRVGSLDHSLSTKVLASKDVDMEKLEVVSLGQPAIRAQALAAGQIDATTISIGVWLSLPDKAKLHVLVSQDDYYAAAPVVSKVNVVSLKTIETRRDDVKAVIRAITKASRDFANKPDAWVEAMVKARPDVAKADLDQLSANFAKSWSVNGGMNRKELDFTADWFAQSEDFKDLPKVPFENWADLSLVDEVLADIGSAPDLDQPAR